MRYSLHTYVNNRIIEIQKMSAVTVIGTVQSLFVGENNELSVCSRSTFFLGRILHLKSIKTPLVMLTPGRSYLRSLGGERTVVDNIF